MKGHELCWTIWVMFGLIGNSLSVPCLQRTNSSIYGLALKLHPSFIQNNKHFSHFTIPTFEIRYWFFIVWYPLTTFMLRIMRKWNDNGIETDIAHVVKINAKGRKNIPILQSTPWLLITWWRGQQILYRRSLVWIFPPWEELTDVI